MDELNMHGFGDRGQGTVAHALLRAAPRLVSALRQSRAPSTRVSTQHAKSVRHAWLFAIALAIVMTGCSLRGGGKSAKATPPPPKPAPAASPKAPEGPLSVPQTQVQLPPPQPVNPMAVAGSQEPQEPAPEPAAAPQAKPPRRPAPVAAAPAKPAAEPPPAAAVQPQPPVEERPRLQEIVSPEERKKLADQMAARKKEIEEALRIAGARPLSDHDRNIVDRIKSFLQLSDQALARGEMRQAEALSERALILARELRVAR